MMVKLQGIIDRADMHTRSPDVLRKYADDYSIAIDWNGDRMIFDGSVEKQWNILRLLDEARTLGPVTGKHWDTSARPRFSVEIVRRPDNCPCRGLEPVPQAPHCPALGTSLSELVPG